MNVIEVHQINENLYILNEALTPAAYFTMALAVGSEKAAIIDTGYGAAGDLGRVIRQITDKPVVCLLTHCDPDHAGGAALFDEIHMSSLDGELMNKGSVSFSARRMMVTRMVQNPELAAYVKTHMVRDSKFSYQNIQDGDRFELGGNTLEAIALPGHSKGSMCFYNRAERYAVTGDSVANANSPVLFFDKCEPLSIYQKNLERFVEKVGPGVTIYTGHDVNPLGEEIIPEIFTLCGEIIAGETAGDTPYLPPFLRAGEGRGPGRALMRLALKAAAKKQLGDSVPFEHKKAGFIASVKYNARKI